MLSVILPTYNESENLPILLPALAKELSGREYEILLVDDDSPDRTWEVARSLSVQFPAVHVVRRVGRRGLSSAVIEGFLAAKGDVLAVMDADGQHDMSLLTKLAQAVENGADIAVGSRYVEGGSVGEWDERRHALSRLATKLAIRLCKVTMHDPMSGFFAIRRSSFEQALPLLNPKGFKILLDLLVHVPRNTKVQELPFTFHARLHGQSKLSHRVQIEFIEYLYDVTFGRFLPLTFVKYCLVGVLGVLVTVLSFQLFTILLAKSGFTDARLFDVSLLLAIEIAILSNFFLNNAWTFGLARLRGGAALRGLLTYNVACVFGVVTNFAVTSFLFGYTGAQLPSVAAGAFTAAVWNYTMSRLLTWRV